MRRAKKWTYLTWCDLRNHPFMLLGAVIGAMAFAFVVVTQSDQSKRIGGVEHTIKVPRNCRISKLPPPPHGRVILICEPATKSDLKRAQQADARRAARRAARQAAKRSAARTKSRPGKPDGNQGVSPSPPASHPPAPQPSPAPSPPQSGGGSSSPPASQPPPAPAPHPGITTPQVGPVGPITVPLPSLPPLPGS